MFRFWFPSVLFLWIHGTPFGRCDLFCEKPPVIENTVFSPSGLQEYPSGTILKYFCDFGYLSHQAPPTTRCIVGRDPYSAVWTNIKLNCIPRSCGDPGNINHGRLNGSVFSFPHSVTYTCDEGYRLQGSSLRRFCQPNGDWSGDPPSCVEVTCDVPKNPESGRAIYYSTEYKAELRYECSKGFRPDNSKERICGSDGKWSGSMPTCVEVQCNYPKSPEHGSIDLPGGLPNVDSIAYYKCNEGRKLVGALRTKCLASGDWTFPPPNCVEPCTAPAIPNGFLIKYTGRWSSQQIPVGTGIEDENKLYLRCYGKFEPNGQSVKEVHVSCSDGKWSFEPKCVASSCTSPPPLTDHATLQTRERYHGIGLYYKCYKHYYKFKSGNVTCLEGQWVGITPICKDSHCHINYSNFPGIQKQQHGDYRNRTILTPQCREGYKLLDKNNKMTCIDGVWMTAAFPCTGATCDGPPPSVVNGNIEVVSGLHGTSVKYVCNEYFHLKESSEPVMCDLGNWKGEAPECKESRCYLNNLVYKKGIDLADSSETYSGEYAETKCVKGFTLKNYKPKCSAGQWQEYFSSPCVESNCVVTALANGWYEFKKFAVKQGWTGSYTVITYETVRINAHQSHGTTLFVSCNSPFTVNGKAHSSHVPVKCNKGEWDPQPYCLTRGQNPLVPDQESNAAKFGSTLRPQQLSTINEGNLVNLERTTQLVPKNPDVISTPEPLDIQNPNDCFCTYNNLDLNLAAYSGQKRLEFGEKVEKDSTIQFSCRIIGYHRLKGSMELSCQNCDWHSSEFPTCVPPVRGEPIISVNTKPPDSFAFSPSGILYVKPHVDIDIMCHLENANELIHLSGPLKNVKPSYDYITVGEQHIWTGLLMLTRVTPSDSGIYFCSRESDGRISHQVHIKIEDISCPAIKEDDDLAVNYVTEGLTKIAILSCLDQNKELSGPDRLKCMANGHWSEDVPKCTKIVSCPQLNETEGLTITYTDRKKLNSSAIFHCAEPYRRKGLSVVTCMSDGEWSESPASCVAPTCLLDSLLDALPATATVNQENVSTILPYGTSLKVICQDENFHVIGNSTATCKESGKWLFGDIKCVSGCGLIKQSEQSSLIVEPIKDVYKFGDSVVFRCHPGQQLIPDIQRVTCLQNYWSENFPECHDA